MSFDIEPLLGAYPSKWDPSHYRVRTATLSEAQTLPEEYTELLDYVPVPHPHQGNIGTCVGWDGATVMEITNTLLYEYANRNGNAGLLNYVQFDLSAGWLYHWSRYYADIPDWMEGSTNLGLVKALNKRGTALENDVPTDTVKPWDGITYNTEIEGRAMDFAVDSYWNVNNNPTDVKSAIYGITHPAPYEMSDGSPGKIPIVSAYPVYVSFYDANSNEGVVPLPSPGERLLGGHSSAIVGWKIIDGKEYYININSWGPDKGDNGIFYIPTDYPFYSQDWWIIHNGPAPVDPIPDPDPNPYPSICEYGNGAAKILNTIPWAMRRQGRFYYMNPPETR